MKDVVTKKEACEAYGAKWQVEHLTEDTWQLVLDRLYRGQKETDIVRKLKLNPSCKSSMRVHRNKHKRWIAYMQAVSIKDHELALAASMATTRGELLAVAARLSLDEGMRPGIRIKAIDVGLRALEKFDQLAERVIEQAESQAGKRQGKDLKEMLSELRKTVFGLDERDD